MSDDRGLVVVGVDGSDASLSALRWAVEYGRQTGSVVNAVKTWHYPWAMQTAPEQTDAAVTLKTREDLDDAITRAGVDLTGVTLEREVREGHPSNVLVKESYDADLLVLGRRHHPPPSHVLSGSISRFCLAHAACPVVVVKVPGDVPLAPEAASGAVTAGATGESADSTSSPGQWAQGTLEEIDEEACWRFLAEKELGRIVVVRQGYPEIFPVNYVLYDNLVVFRTGLGKKFDWAVMSPVAFEVEEIDPTLREGWVVEVRGTGRDLTDALDETSELVRSSPLTPWAGGDRSNWVAIVNPKISGRRLLHPDVESVGVRDDHDRNTL